MITLKSRRVRVPKCAFCCRWREITSFESPQKSDGDTSFDQETTDPFQDETGKSATDPDVVARISCDVSNPPGEAEKSSDDASKSPNDSSKTPVGASNLPSDVSTAPGDVSSVPADAASVVTHSPAALSHDTALVKTEAPSIAAVTHPTEVAVVRGTAPNETAPDEKALDVTEHRPAEPSGVERSDVDKQSPDVDATDQEARQGKGTVTSPLGTTGDGAVLDVDKDASDGVSAADDAVTSSHVGAPSAVSRPEPFVKLKEGVVSEDNPSEDEQVIIYFIISSPPPSSCSMHYKIPLLFVGVSDLRRKCCNEGALVCGEAGAG